MQSMTRFFSIDYKDKGWLSLDGLHSYTTGMEEELNSFDSLDLGLATYIARDKDKFNAHEEPLNIKINSYLHAGQPLFMHLSMASPTPQVSWMGKIQIVGIWQDTMSRTCQ